VTVTERRFDVKAGERLVPGILWRPSTGALNGLVLVGHGGTFGSHGHKGAPWMVDTAERYAAFGLAAAAIDMPGCGDRPDAEEEAKRRQGMSIEQALAELWTDKAIDETIEDWQAALDFLEAEPDVGPVPVGYSGLSGGTMFGLPLVANEPRIKAAILGLNGAVPRLVADAARITCPVLYLQNLEDSFGPRETGLALFDAFASTDKRIHAHPGDHGNIPADEFDDCGRFLLDRLTRS